MGVDDEVQVWADGVSVGSTTGWVAPATMNVPGSTVMLAFRIQNNGGPASFIASLSNGIVTDASWKCTNEAQSGDG